MLNKAKLGSGIIDIRFKSNHHSKLEPFQASGSVREIVKDMMESKHDKGKLKKLKPHDLAVVKHMRGLFGVGADDDEENPEEKWQLLQGALLSTSKPSELLKQEARDFLQAGKILKRISKAEHAELLKELGL